MLIWNTATLVEIIKTRLPLKKKKFYQSFTKKNVAAEVKKSKTEIIGSQFNVLLSTNTGIILALCLDSLRQNIK